MSMPAEGQLAACLDSLLHRWVSVASAREASMWLSAAALTSESLHSNITAVLVSGKLQNPEPSDCLFIFDHQGCPHYTVSQGLLHWT